MLTEVRIRSARPKKKPYKLSAGSGLQCWINPGGSRVWRYRWRRPDPETGKRCIEQSITIGEWPTMTLQQARAKALELKALCRQGQDPAVEEKKRVAAVAAAARNTFDAVVRDWWETSFVRDGRADTHHARQVIREIERDLLPFIGEKPFVAVEYGDLKPLLERVYARTRSRGHRLCITLGMVYRHARDIRHIVVRDPVPGLKLDFRAPPKGHLKAVTKDFRRLGEILLAIDSHRDIATRSALQLLSLSLARPGEVVSMKWSDVDLDAATWTRVISKSNPPRELILPLSRQALAVLELMKVQSGHGEWVFPHGKAGSGCMARNSLGQALVRLGIRDQHAHGWRATGRTILDERLRFRTVLIELTLGHTQRDPNGDAYNRAAYLEDRKAMMQRWGDFLDECRRGSELGI